MSASASITGDSCPPAEVLFTATIMLLTCPVSGGSSDQPTVIFIFPTCFVMCAYTGRTGKVDVNRALKADIIKILIKAKDRQIVSLFRVGIQIVKMISFLNIVYIL
jgi:hypothetical protein